MALPSGKLPGIIDPPFADVFPIEHGHTSRRAGQEKHFQTFQTIQKYIIYQEGNHCPCQCLGFCGWTCTCSINRKMLIWNPASGGFGGTKNAGAHSSGRAQAHAALLAHHSFSTVDSYVLCIGTNNLPTILKRLAVNTSQCCLAPHIPNHHRSRVITADRVIPAGLTEPSYQLINEQSFV